MCYRYMVSSGEGLIGSWVALVLYVRIVAITKTGILLPVMSWINKPTNINANMSQTTGIPMWVFTLVLTIITIIL